MNKDYVFTREDVDEVKKALWEINDSNKIGVDMNGRK